MYELITVPIAFDTKVVVKGGTKERQQTFGEHVDLEVEVVDASDAPIAITWQTKSYDGDEVALIDKTLRWHDGRLWKNYQTNNSREHPRNISLEDVRRSVETGYGNNPFAVGNDYDVREFMTGKIGTLDPTLWRKADMATRNLAVAKAIRSAEKLIVIDGEVWRHAPEPVYTISYSSGRDYRAGLNNPPSVYVSIHDSAAAAHSNDNLFRADRYDDMVAFSLNRWELEPENDTYLAVHVPESVRHDDEWPPMIGAIRSAIKFEESYLKDMPTERLVSWATARDALKSFSTDETDHDAREALIQAVRDYIPVARSFEANAYSAQVMEHAFLRWDAVYSTTIDIDMEHSL